MSTTPLPWPVVRALEEAVKLLDVALSIFLADRAGEEAIDRLVKAVRMTVAAGRAVIDAARGAA
jgi:hypothetical protein